jgi:hypothetical protein
VTKTLRNIRLKWEIQDIWRHTHPNVREFTYRTKTREHTTQSRLDRIYVAKHLQQHLFNWKHYPAITCTDHWMVMVKFAPKDAPFVRKGRWSWPRASLEDKKLISKITTRGLALQSNISEWKTHNMDHERTNPQLMWETFKSDIRKIAKTHTNTTTHKIIAKARSLDKDRKATAVTRDFEHNEDLQSEEAFLANEITHLERTMAKTQKEIFRA